MGNKKNKRFVKGREFWTDEDHFFAWMLDFFKVEKEEPKTPTWFVPTPEIVFRHPGNTSVDLTNVTANTWVCGSTVVVSTGNDGDGGEGRAIVSATGEIPTFDILDKVLEVIAPEITYLKYKKVLSEAQIHSDTEHEYYGDYKVVAYQYVKLGNLYTALKPYLDTSERYLEAITKES